MPLLITSLFALCLLAIAPPARAESASVEFDGQRYLLEYEKAPKPVEGQPGNGLAEFTLEGESAKNWTKLFAFHVYPEAGNDPSLAAARLGKVVQEDNPDANFALQENKEKGDAIIDFLTWAPGSDVMEFNVFKYARAQYGPGLVALQFAQRFTLDDMNVNEFRALRARAVEAMAETDIAPARDYFATLSKERVGSARSEPQGSSLGSPSEDAAARAGAAR